MTEPVASSSHPLTRIWMKLMLILIENEPQKDVQLLPASSSAVLSSHKLSLVGAAIKIWFPLVLSGTFHEFSRASKSYLQQEKKVFLS